MTALHELSVAEAGRRLAAGELTAVALLESVLARAEETEPAVQAYVTILREEALEAAAAADAELAAGRRRGPLHGIPISLKDLFDMAGLRTGVGSAARADHRAGEDAEVTRRLRGAGAVICGKTVAHECAMGVQSPPARTPWDTARSPGGSSGGSAASVAAGSSLASLGSDTGCSIRLPAAFCGIVGLKPTYGLVSKRGAAPSGWTCDHVGPLTRTVEDAALVLAAIAGRDPLDRSTVDRPVPDLLGGLDEPVAGLRVGVPRNYFFDPCEPRVERCVREAIGVLERAGAELVEVEMPLLEHTLAAAFVICLVEGAAYHRRTLRDRGRLYGEGVRLLYEAGACVFAADYVDAQRVRTLVCDAVRTTFETQRIDVLATPSAPVVPPPAGQTEISIDGEPAQPALLALARTYVPFNVTGQPAISVPCGFVDGLPVGLQIVGRPFGEPTVLRVARAYERETAFGERRPDPVSRRPASSSRDPAPPGAGSAASLR